MTDHSPQNKAHLHLWAAVMQLGITDAASKGADSPRARRWYRSNEVSARSFTWVCEMLNIDPAFARRRAESINPKLRQLVAP